MFRSDRLFCSYHDYVLIQVNPMGKSPSFKLNADQWQDFKEHGGKIPRFPRNPNSKSLNNYYDRLKTYYGDTMGNMVIASIGMPKKRKSHPGGE